MINIINYNFKKGSRKSFGFTFVELAIYMGILLILILILTDILYSILNVSLSTQSTSSVARDGRYIYSRFIYDVNRASAVSIPQNLGDTSSNLLLTISGANYNYYLQSGNLYINDGTTDYILNSPDTTFSDLEFERIGNLAGKHTFQIKFNIISKIRVNNTYDSASFQTTAGLR